MATSTAKGTSSQPSAGNAITVMAVLRDDESRRALRNLAGPA